MLRLFIFLVILLVPTKCFGQEFFDYTLNRHLLFPAEIFKAELTFEVGSIPLKRFLVRPVLKNGSLQVCCNAVGEWVFANNLWTNMPVLDKEINLKFVNFTNTEIQKGMLSFEVLDTKTGVIYKTPEKPFWIGSPIYANYVKKVNNWVSARKNAEDLSELNANAYKMLKLTNDPAPQ